MRLAYVLVLITILCSCAEQASLSHTNSSLPPKDLPRFFTCMDNAGQAIVAAHRGGPAPGYPENAKITIDRMVKNGVWLLEVDVSTSKDGVLFLHHDDDLDNSTSGTGLVKELPWAELSTVTLLDTNGQPTPYRIFRLDDALRWAEGKAVLELDIKRGTDYDDVALMVRSAGAEHRVVPIAYTLGQAKALNSRFPDSMISVPVTSQQDLRELMNAGLDSERILSWGGIENIDTDLFESLDSSDVEVAFGTLGWKDSIDSQIAASEDDSAYADIVRAGVDVISSDRPIAARNALVDAGIWPDETCQN